MRSLIERILLRWLPMLVLACALAGCGRSSSTIATSDGGNVSSLTIFYTCDTRGHVEPCRCVGGRAGGVARRAFYLSGQRASGLGPSLLVDAGNVTAGARDWERLELEYLLMAYTAMGYHAVNAGHREAGLGLERLREAQDRSGLLISANLTDRDGRLVLPGSRIVDVGGGRVGIIGVMDDAIEPTEIGPGLRIAPAGDSVARELAAMRGNTDWVVVLAFADETAMRALADRFFEVAAIIGGNVRQPSAEPVRANKSVLAYITDKGKSVGRLDLSFLAGGTVAVTNDIVMLDDRMPDDEAMARLTSDLRARLQEMGIDPSQKRDDEEGLTLIGTPAASKREENK